MRHADIRQGDGAADGVREVPVPLHPRHARGIRLVRGREIPGCPGGEPQERRNRLQRSDEVSEKAGEVVLRLVQRQPGGWSRATIEPVAD